MNRKQLEDCAWTKTPKDERRSQKERYDWKTKKTVTERLQGNSREVLVFDPSGDTPGTMSPWVPLWSLYSDELQQRCEGGQQPKLRAPYHRARHDYTGDVESSDTAAPPRHATRKTQSAQLDREIAQALARKSNQHHSTISGVARPDRSIFVRPTSTRWPGGIKVRIVKFGADVRQGVRAALPIGSLAAMHPDAGERLPDGTVRVHEDELRDTAD